MVIYDNPWAEVLLLLRHPFISVATLVLPLICIYLLAATVADLCASAHKLQSRMVICAVGGAGAVVLCSAFGVFWWQGWIPGIALFATLGLAILPPLMWWYRPMKLPKHNNLHLKSAGSR
ncbi:hypothetical protein [Nesterenkonia ebinurensis]|uniref:hypothetical protein n=1 Tax=Nesterenkonia ebinurensis TaxID=2608252 RepID=UPI00123D5931|nr:hypothetical protein [Nesterenkonia ebinurensis]